jgi:hypothetical protein
MSMRLAVDPSSNAKSSLLHLDGLPAIWGVKPPTVVLLMLLHRRLQRDLPAFSSSVAYNIASRGIRFKGLPSRRSSDCTCQGGTSHSSRSLGLPTAHSAIYWSGFRPCSTHSRLILQTGASFGFEMTPNGVDGRDRLTQGSD